MGLLFAAGTALNAGAPVERLVWASPLSEMTYVQIERELARPDLDPEELAELPREERFVPLPAEVEAALGAERVDYESFVGVRVSAADLIDLEAQLIEAGLQYWTRSDESLWLPHSSREAGTDGAAEVDVWKEAGIRRARVPGRFLLEMAYPAESSWVELFEECGVSVLGTAGQWTLSVRAQDLDRLLGCPAIERARRVNSQLTTDRIAPRYFAAEQEQWELGWWLEYPASLSWEELITELPAGAEVRDHLVESISARQQVRVLIDRPGLAQLINSSRWLNGVTPVQRAEPSDERQGQILAGNHNGSSVTATGYRSWLSGRGLLSSSNQQTVAVFDTGYEDGTFYSHHPDLSSPVRLVDAKSFEGTGFHDPTGHGTMVAGIIAGDGTAGVGTGASDPQGFTWGTGIAPKASIVAIKLFDRSAAPSCWPSSAAGDLSKLQDALNYARNNNYGYSKALIGNNSWNFRGGQGDEYNTYAQFYDAKVLDASDAWVGNQPMTLVFSAGNAGYIGGSAAPDTVRSPAVAKNVISVGATENYRPLSQFGQPPNSCEGYNSGELQDATHIARIAKVSSRGARFEPYPATPRLEDVRVKPDLVAPGVRITSTVPYANEATYDCGHEGSICANYFPEGVGHQYHSYAIGTSFAAPAATGAAALKRKWFLDRGVDPAPSLIKAALIATADDLGSFSEYYGDHRPSWHYGWGRVNLNRLTDSAARFYLNEGWTIFTGTTRSWTRTVDNGSRGTLIVLAWSDVPSGTANTTQVPLENDLSLRVDEGSSVRFWRGNNLRENKEGVDDGYSHPFVIGGDPILTDSMNNVEVVFIPAGTLSTGSQLTVRVTGDNVTDGPQLFSIYAYNLRLSS